MMSVGQVLSEIEYVPFDGEETVQPQIEEMCTSIINSKWLILRGRGQNLFLGVVKLFFFFLKTFFFFGQNCFFGGELLSLEKLHLANFI